MTTLLGGGWVSDCMKCEGKGVLIIREEAAASIMICPKCDGKGEAREVQEAKVTN